MNVLVLGSGAREHALCWKLQSSPLLSRLHAAPGNPGIEACALTHASVPATDSSAVLALCYRERIDLVVVGPEAPLVGGVSDALRGAGIAVFGPSAAAARIEGSKAFAKEVMVEAGIPTAESVVHTDHLTARAHAAKAGACVVKADGLAAGKGVVVCRSSVEAVAAVDQLIASLGSAATTIVFEELLVGDEVSAIALCDGARYALLPFAQDFKRLRDDDLGPNTGGMGAYAPAFAGDPRLERVGELVIGPALRAMTARGTPFVGALYAGLMLTREGLRVLEFNARFGDPECQVLMPVVDEDLLPWLRDAALGHLPERDLRIAPGAALGVVLAAHGYPELPRSGDAISGLDDSHRDPIFQAGTRRVGEAITTAGGRVLTAWARAGSLRAARELAYAAVQRVSFDGAQYRADIGAKAVG